METRSHGWMDEADFFTVQDWSAYSTVDHDVWHTMYDRRLQELEETGSRIFLSGCEAIGLGPERVPDLSEVNGRLEKLTGWRSVPVTGFIPGTDFFRCLAHRRFPTTVTVRPPDRLEYVPSPTYSMMSSGTFRFTRIPCSRTFSNASVGPRSSHAAKRTRRGWVASSGSRWSSV